MAILIFLIILTILVLIHELGHFLTARKFGIKVEEFGFGLPPRAFGIKKGGTIYSINWLPIGGFVKLYGEDEAGGGKLEVRSKKLGVVSKARSFAHRPAWQRATIVVAGVAMNFALAVLLISYLFTQGVPLPREKVHIEAVAKDSPAHSSGLREKDIVSKIDNREIKTPDDLQTYTKDKLGQTVKLTIAREGKTFEVEIIPRREPPKGEGPIGIAISNIEIVKYPWYQAPIVGTIESLKLSWLTVSSFGLSLGRLIFQGVVPQDVAGPVGIAQLTGYAVTGGVVSVISLTALLSLNLAILNILPIPALDGGRLFFILIEMVVGKRVSPHFERYAHTIGMIILLTLIALITLRDISRLVNGQPILPIP